MASNEKTSQDTPPSILSWLISATVGISFSGGILQASKILRPNFKAIPKPAYDLFTQSAFFINVVSWIPVYISGVSSALSNKTLPLKDKVSEHIQNLEAYLTIDDKTVDGASITLNKLLQSRLKKEQSFLTKTINEEAEAYKKRKPIRQILDWVPGISILRSYPNTHQNRLNAINAYIAAVQENLPSDEPRQGNKTDSSNEDGQSDEQNKKPKTTEKISYDDSEARISKILWANIQLELPGKKFDSLGAIANYFSYKLASLSTIIYSFFTNSTGFMIMGGLGFLSLLQITHPVFIAITLTWFFSVGIMSAYSFSRPGALAGFQMLFSYDTETRNIIHDYRKKGQRSGLLKLPLWLHIPLALVLSASIAIVNAAANIALGEVLFAHQSLFSPTLFISALTTPLAAHPLSLAFGLIGGLSAFITLSLMLTSAVMRVEPKANVKSSNPHKHIPFLLAAFLLSSYASPVLFVAMLAVTVYALMYDPAHTLSSNIINSGNVVISTFLNYFFNLPVFSLALSPLSAVIVSGVCAFANAELTPPVLNSNQINEWEKRIVSQFKAGLPNNWLPNNWSPSIWLK